MKKQKLFNKGEYCYSLLYSYNHPNILIPVKGKVIDIKMDKLNPKYQIQILKFYDRLYFLKKFFFDMNFHRNFDDRATPITINRNEISSGKELVNRMNTGPDKEKFYIITDSVMTTSSVIKLEKLFHDAQFYVISNHLKEIKQLMNRKMAKNPFQASHNEFNQRMILGWGDKFKDADIPIKTYLDSLIY